MKASEMFNIAKNVSPNAENFRFNKYIFYLEKDITYAAKLGKYYYKVNYIDKVVTEEFIFNLQEYFRGNEFEIITNEDPLKYKEFIIKWESISD